MSNVDQNEPKSAKPHHKKKIGSEVDTEIPFRTESTGLLKVPTRSRTQKEKKGGRNRLSSKIQLKEADKRIVHAAISNMLIPSNL